MKTATNKREFTRVPVQLEVEVRSEQPVTTGPCEVKDISLRGLYLCCEHPLPLGSACQVTLILSGGEPPLRIEVGGSVTRVDPAGMGVEITNVVGVESFEHLRNVVLYNASNPNQVEQEFHDHVGIKRRENH